MNIFNKFKFLSFYNKTIKQYSEILFKNHKIKVDKLGRMYTVLTFDENINDNIKQYGYYYLDNEVRKYIKEVQILFLDIGIIELVGYSKVDQIDGFNVLIIFEYNKLDVKKLFYIKIISIIVLFFSSIISLILFL